MLQLIKNFFKKKEVKEPFYHPYPINELSSMRKYKNEQHEKAMKAPIDKTDRIRKAGW